MDKRKDIKRGTERLGNYEHTYGRMKYNGKKEGSISYFYLSRIECYQKPIALDIF